MTYLRTALSSDLPCQSTCVNSNTGHSEIYSCFANFQFEKHIFEKHNFEKQTFARAKITMCFTVLKLAFQKFALAFQKFAFQKFAFQIEKQNRNHRNKLYYTVKLSVGVTNNWTFLFSTF